MFSSCSSVLRNEHWLQRLRSLQKPLIITGQPLSFLLCKFRHPFGHLQLLRCWSCSAAWELGLSLDVKDQPVLGQEEVGMALLGYCCCLSPFPTDRGRNEWKKSLHCSFIKPRASRLASLPNVSSVKRLIHSSCSRDT